METKLIAMVVGAVLVLATATVYTQSASAVSQHNNCSQDCAAIIGSGNGNHNGNGNGAGVIGGGDGQQAHGLANACSHPNVAAHNPNCGQTPTGAAGAGTLGGATTGR
jgi:hypothetical protein